jgi:thioester reductase-like protein
MGTKQILITGGDGYFGLKLARLYLASAGNSVFLWIRASDEQEFEEKTRKLKQELHDFAGRVCYGYGDLNSEQPFDSVDPDNVHVIIHAAAVTRFNVDEETARRTNIEGTEKLLRFADRCPAFEALGLLSSIYASGLKDGAVDEIRFGADAGFANHYEWSKWASEEVLLTGFNHLPWRIFRIATVIADDIEGRVTQQNALHNTLKLLYYGLLSMIPGNLASPIYLVTGDFAADSIFSLITDSPLRSIYHVAHSQGESVTLEELIEIAFSTFNEDIDFRSNRILRPLFCDHRSFELLVDGISHFNDSVLNQAIASVAPFASQMFVKKDLGNQKLVSALHHYEAPEAAQLVRNTCKYLVQTKWRRRIEHAVA